MLPTRATSWFTSGPRAGAGDRCLLLNQEIGQPGAQGLDRRPRPEDQLLLPGAELRLAGGVEIAPASRTATKRGVDPSIAMASISVSPNPDTWPVGPLTVCSVPS
jgi:hypothetical protein